MYLPFEILLSRYSNKQKRSIILLQWVMALCNAMIRSSTTINVFAACWT